MLHVVQIPDARCWSGTTPKGKPSCRLHLSTRSVTKSSRSSIVQIPSWSDILETKATVPVVSSVKQLLGSLRHTYLNVCVLSVFFLCTPACYKQKSSSGFVKEGDIPTSFPSRLLPCGLLRHIVDEYLTALVVLLQLRPPVLKPHAHPALGEAECLRESVAGLNIWNHPLLKGCFKDR